MLVKTPIGPGSIDLDEELGPPSEEDYEWARKVLQR